MDNNLADPNRSKKISQWYLDNIRKLPERLREKQQDIDLLCFIEKPYSDVGALSLMPFLVRELNLPATIYRAGYWDPGARITGEPPFMGTEACFIYDVIIGGNTIIEAAEYLNKNFGTKTRAALVFIEYDEAKGRKKLEENGIVLESFLKYSDIKDEVRIKGNLVKKMRSFINESPPRKYDDYLTELGKDLKEYGIARKK